MFNEKNKEIKNNPRYFASSKWNKQFAKFWFEKGIESVEHKFEEIDELKSDLKYSFLYIEELLYQVEKLKMVKEILNARKNFTVDYPRWRTIMEKRFGQRKKNIDKIEGEIKDEKTDLESIRD